MKKRLLVLIVLFATISGFSQPCQQILADIGSSATFVSGDSALYYSVDCYAPFTLNATGIYPENETGYLQSDETSTFIWEFGDGGTDTAANVTYSYSMPGLFPVTLHITDINGCEYDTVFYIYSYPELVVEYWGTEDSILVGDTLYFNGYISDDQMMFVDDTVYLPDGSGVSYVSSVVFDGFAPGAQIDSLNELFSINANMEHSFLGDLIISMTCPNGTTVILESQGGGGIYLGEPIDGTGGEGPGIGYDYGWSLSPDFPYFMFEYSDSFGGITLPTGTYESYEPLTNFIGCPMNGEWQITVTDNWSIDDGYIFGWWLDLNYINLFFPPSAFSWSSPAKADIIYNNPADGSAWVIPSEPGWHEYTFTVTSSKGVTKSKTIEVYVAESSVGIEKQPVAKTTFNAYPNPFNEKMVLEYYLTKQENVKIEVTNIIGKKIKTLMNGIQPAGSYYYNIDGKELESGIYMVKFTAGSQTFTKKLVRE